MSLRMTNQREVILRRLKESKTHPTADELYELVRKDMPRISLATVYRNLEILSEAGVISKLEISGRQKRFDYDIEDHDHIYCVQCHRVDNLEIDRKALSEASLQGETDYNVTGYRLEFVGLCPRCRKTNKKGKEI